MEPGAAAQSATGLFDELSPGGAELDSGTGESVITPGRFIKAFARLRATRGRMKQ
jgi:hypothetical protein